MMTIEKMSNRGYFVFDLTVNSEKYHYKKCVADSDMWP